MSDSQAHDSDAFERKYQQIQSQDDAEISDAVRGVIEAQRERAAREDTLETEGYVRGLLKQARSAIGSREERRASEIMTHVRSVLENDADLEQMLQSPTALAENLGEEITVEMAAKYRATYQAHERARSQGRFPDAEKEAATLSAVAQALGYENSIHDPSNWTPLVVENLGHLGSLDEGENPTPVGRRRLSAENSDDLDARKVEIPHDSCDHILACALPRSGKDSTLTSIGMNLWEEHGYSYFSIFDDGRMETPMLPIPTDEEVIQQNLERLNQEPRGFDAEVLVPRMEDSVPDRLPANFTQFTIGIDQLTPEMILNFAGVNKREGDVVHRIEQALDETLANGGDVAELIFKLNLYARETPAEVTWTETVGEREGGSTVTKTAEYKMPASDVLTDAANQLARLAGDGLITSPAAATNIDMAEVIADQETATVLCTSFLGRGQEPLKYYIINLWLELIWEAREENARLPRACLEIRELKDLAPSKHGFGGGQTKAIRALKQTLFRIGSRGGSRGIMMLASTQKLNDVEKSIRQNFATKVLLRQNEEGIETLDRSHNFTDEERRQLNQFSIGWGMVVAGGQKYYPVELRGSPCALSLKNEFWLDRYGLAFGAEVRPDPDNDNRHDPWVDGGDRHCEWWVHVPDQTVHDPAEEEPSVGDYYSQWYLTDEHFPDGTTGDDVAGNEALIRSALKDRRPYPPETDLMLQSTEAERGQEEVTFNPEELPTVEEVAKNFEVPQQIRDWLDKDRDVREKLVTACEILDEEGPVRAQSDWAAPHPDYKRGSLKNHIGVRDDGSPKSLEPCYKRTENDEYVLSIVGEKVVELPWDRINVALYEGDQ